MRWTPEIVTIEQLRIVGLKQNMSLAANTTGELWQQFIHQCRIEGIDLPGELVSAAIYPSGYFDHFQPQLIFEKWAGFAIAGDKLIPEGLEELIIPAGLFAKFFYKGSPADPGIFQFIFSEWLPNSAYCVDGRAHFELLGEAYRNDHPDSEEYIFIPIALKA
jgi:AraC family transcriptional regulator